MKLLEQIRALKGQIERIESGLIRLDAVLQGSVVRQKAGRQKAKRPAKQGTYTQKIRAVLASANGAAIRAGALAQASGTPPNYMAQYLKTMMRRGEVERVGRGLYRRKEV